MSNPQIAMVVAVVLLVLAAFGIGHQRVNLGWLGLAIWAAVSIWR